MIMMTNLSLTNRQLVWISPAQAEDNQQVVTDAPMTDIMSELAQSVCLSAEAAIDSPQLTSGSWQYVITEAGDAVVTAYTGSATQVSLPLSLGGAPVAALWENAVPASVTYITLHGNVLYIHPQAVAKQTDIACSQGSYALAWACSEGRTAYSTTNGTLQPGAIDLCDVAANILPMSETVLKMTNAEARRLPAGSLLYFRNSRDTVELHQVQEMRTVNGYVIVTTSSPEISDVICDMSISGVIYMQASDFTGEAGVSVSGAQGSNGEAQVVLKSVITGSDSDTDSPNLNNKYDNGKWDASFSMNITSTMTEMVQYEIEIVRGQVIYGRMVRDSTSVLSVEGKFEKTLYEKKLDEYFDSIKSMRNDKSFGKCFLPIILGTGITISAKLELTGAIMGKGTITTHTINESTYQGGTWITTDTQVLQKDGDGHFGGEMELALVASASYGLPGVINLLQISEGIYVTVACSTGNEILNGYPCAEITFDIYLAAKAYVGIWAEYGDHKLGISSSNLLKEILPPVYILQGIAHFHELSFHTKAQCMYMGGDYQVSFVVDAGLDVNKLDYSDAINSDGSLNWNYLQLPLELPDLSNISITLNDYHWAVQNDQGEYVPWSNNASFQQNLIGALGIDLIDADDLPQRIFLYARWDDEVSVTFDAMGGLFYITASDTQETLTCFKGKHTLLTEPAQPLYPFHSLAGWYTTSDYSGEPWDFLHDTVQGEMTLYAKWNYHGLNSSEDPNALETIIGDPAAKHYFRSASNNVMLLDADNGYLSATQLDILGADGFSEDIMAIYGCTLNEVDYANLKGMFGTVESVDGKPICFHITKYRGSQDALVIPAYINNIPVSVDSNAFEGSNVKAIRLLKNENILSVSPYAFANAAYLEHVDASFTVMNQIPDYCFYGCKSLRLVEMPTALSSIGEFAFSGCSLLQKISLGNISFIGACAFEGCGVRDVLLNAQKLGRFNLVSAGLVYPIHLEIGETTRIISDQAFYSCLSIVSLKTHGALESIGSQAFYGCENLTTLQLAEGLNYIDYGTFAYCTSLEEAILPSTANVELLTLSSSFLSAFEGCTSLTALMIGGSHIGALDSLVSLKELTVHEGAKRITGFTKRSTRTVLERLHLPSTLECIVYNSFQNCTALQEVTILGCDSIESSAFQNCSSLTKLVLGPGVEYIGTYAFDGCTSLSSVTIPEGVRNIQPSCFANTAIMDFNIPSTVESYLGATGGKKLRSLTIHSQTAYQQGGSSLETADTLILGGNVTELVSFPYAKYPEIILGSSIRKISNFSFQLDGHSVHPIGAEAKPGIVLPEGIEHIGYYAFRGSNLTELTLPSTVKSIGTAAFQNCTELSMLKLNEGLESIGDSAFDSCPLEGEFIIPATVVELNHAFSTSNRITSITVGGSLSKLPTDFFEPLTSTLETLTIRDGVVEMSGLSNMQVLKTIVLPESLLSLGGIVNMPALVSIQPTSSAGKPGLLLSEKLISYGSFYGCTALPSATILCDLPASGFENCTSLTSVVLGNGDRGIGPYGFDGCTALTSITLPSITNVDPTAFSYCTSLRSMTVHCPVFSDQLRQILVTVSSSLEELIFADGLTDFTTYLYPDVLPALRRIVFPDTLTSLPSDALEELSALQEIWLGGGMTSLGKDALPVNAGLTVYVRGEDTTGALTTYCANNAINMVTVTDADARYCVSFVTGTQQQLDPQYLPTGASVNLPGTLIREGYVHTGWVVQETGEKWFEATSRVETADMVLVAVWERESINGLYNVEDGEATLVSYILADGESSAVSLPATYRGVPVTRIAANAFANEGITSLVLPPYLREIEPGAFNAMPELTAVYLNTNNPYYYAVGTGVFQLTDNGSILIMCPKSCSGDLFLRHDTIEIAPYAAADCTRLNDITESYQNYSYELVIGAHAFENCTSLTLLYDVLEFASVIGDYAFAGCTSLQQVTFGLNLQSVGYRIFDNCPALKTATFSYDTVEELPAGILEGCSSLTTVKLGLGMTSIGERAFADCTSLTEVIFRSDITSIGAHAFRNCTSLSDFTLPETVTAIGDSAFRGTNLQDLTLHEGLLSIGSQAYQSCPLNSVTLPSSLQQLGTQVFSDCTNLSAFSFPSTLTVIPEGTFQGCKGFTELEIPAFITEIGADAFRDCSNITCITGGSGLTKIGSNAFFGTSDTCVFYGDRTGTLAQYATQNNRPCNLYLLTFLVNGSQQIASYPQSAGSAIEFMEHNMLSYGEDVRKWYTDSTFETEWDFSTMVMPESSLTLYGKLECAFEFETTYNQDYPDLAEYCIVAYHGRSRNITIPSYYNSTMIRSIGSRAFAGADIDSIELSASLTYIEPDAFDGLTNVTITAPAGSYAAQFLAEAMPDVEWTLSFETNGGALIEAWKLPAEALVELPTPVRDGCIFTGWYVNESLTDSVTLTDAGYYVMPFGGAMLYAAWTVNEEIIHPFTYTQADGSITITGLARDTATLSIPSQINGIPVTAIADRAFLNKSSLTSISLPSSLTSIGSYAFTGTGLTAIVVPDSVTTIGNGALADCTQLKTAQWSASASSVPPEAFRGCTALSHLQLPEGVKILGTSALKSCRSLEILNLPSSVQEICADAMRDMTNLTTIGLGASVTAIQMSAFDGCSALREIAVSADNPVFESVDGVLYLKDRIALMRFPQGRSAFTYTVDSSAFLLEPRAFADCSNLHCVILPSGITDIPACCFENAEQLTEVQLPDKLLSIGDYAFRGCNNLHQLTIPANTTTFGTDFVDQHTVIRGTVGSAAQTWAQSNGRTFADQDIVNAESINLSCSTLEMYIGSSAEITAAVLPANTTDLSVAWHSSNPDIVHVSNGLLRAIGIGNAAITATTTNGLQAQCTVTVLPHRLIMSTDFVILTTETQQQLSAQLTDPHADLSGLEWRSSAPDVATVSSNGVIIPVAYGKAEITALYNDEYRASCLVFVRDPGMEWHFPARLKVVEEEAFSGDMGLRALDLRSSSITSIGDQAFDGCSNLAYIMLPDAITDIGDHAFRDCPHLTLLCHEGSAAWQYAQRNEIPCLPLP